MTGHRLHRLAIGIGLLLTSLVLGHELIYLVAHGFGAGYAKAMQEGGHDRYWTSFVIVVTLVASSLGLVATAQWRRLRRLAAAARTGTIRLAEPSIGWFLVRLGAIWFRLAPGTILAYVVQENTEALSVGGVAQGLGVLGGEHAIGVPLLVAVSLVVAAVAALCRWRRDVLLARIRATAVGPRPRPARVRRAVGAQNRPGNHLEGRRNGVRAPPVSLPTPA